MARKTPISACQSSGILPLNAQPQGAADIVDACIDVSARAGLASYAALYQRNAAGCWAARGASFSYSASGTRKDFIDDLRYHLERGRLVALGFEAPLWGTWAAMPRTGGAHLSALCARPKERNDNRPWYGNAVASEVGPLAVIVLQALGRHVTSGQPGTPPWNAAHPILIWEAYITGDRCCTPKTAHNSGARSQHGQDAKCGVDHGFVNLLNTAQPSSAPATISPNLILTLEWALVANNLAQPGDIRAPVVIKPVPYWGCAVQR